MTAYLFLAITWCVGCTPVMSYTPKHATAHRTALEQCNEDRHRMALAGHTPDVAVYMECFQ